MVRKPEQMYYIPHLFRTTLLHWNWLEGQYWVWGTEGGVGAGVGAGV